MANVQTENGYTKIADELLEALYSTNFSEPERRMIDLIIRYSYGCNKHSITLKQWNDICLAGIPAGKIQHYLNHLKTSNILFIDEDTKTLMLNKNYDQWRIPTVNGYDPEQAKTLLSFNLKVNLSSVILQRNDLPDREVNYPPEGTYLPDREQRSSPQVIAPIDKTNNDNKVQRPKDSIKDSIKDNDQNQSPIYEIMNLVNHKCKTPTWVAHRSIDKDTLDLLSVYTLEQIGDALDIALNKDPKMRPPGILTYAWKVLKNENSQPQKKQDKEIKHYSTMEEIDKRFQEALAESLKGGNK